MRTTTIMLIVTLISPAGVHAQNQRPPQEFALSAFVLALHIPTNVAKADGTPMTTGPVLWLAIRNGTAIPYSLCTAARGWSSGLGGTMGASSHCSSYWIVLPGETHFESLNAPIPQELDTSLGVTVILEGKPAGSMGNVTSWTLSWRGTVGQATALGEQMKANRP